MVLVGAGSSCFMDAVSVWEDGNFQRRLVAGGAEQYECIGRHRTICLKMIVLPQLKKIVSTTTKK